MRPHRGIAGAPAWHLEARRLRRLRLYSYCLTLLACVIGLLAFMYLAQGLADGDTSFAAIGAGFLLGTLGALRVAVLVTHVELPPTRVVQADPRPAVVLRAPDSSATAA